MQASISPSTIQGSITIPASKSAMQRACAAALIKGGKTILSNPGISADDIAALEIIQQLGSIVTKNGEELIIESIGVKPISNTIHCGESGLSVRLFTSLAALYSEEISITGAGSLTKRPLTFFDDVLPQLGVSVQSSNGYLPLRIKGPMLPKNITVDGSLSSQYITGLLFAYSALAASGVTITVSSLSSKPYVDLTLHIMNRFGLKMPENKDYQEFYFDSKKVKKKETVHYAVESDWSSASFLLVAGAVAGSVEIKGLDVFSTQADKAVLQPLMQCGATVSVEPERIFIAQNDLKAFHFNAKDCPDLFPPLVALAANCEGTTVIEGVHRLAHKESNRGLTLQEEFGKLGISITLQDDLMLIKGGIVKSNPVHSRHDHRIAMACAVAALKGNGITTIDEAEAVNKSYPQFWKHLQQATSAVTLI